MTGKKITGKEILDKYQEHLEEPGSRKSTTRLCVLIDQALEDERQSTARRCKEIAQQRYLAENQAVEIDEKISEEFNV